MARSTLFERDGKIDFGMTNVVPADSAKKEW
jgi:hypothetical protein